MTSNNQPFVSPKVRIVSPSDRSTIYLYIGILSVIVPLASPFGGLFDIPVSFLLKNKFHFSSLRVADFRTISVFPLYFSAVFGFIRDTWSPFGIKDRGFLIAFGFAGAAIYASFAFFPVSYGMLFVSIFCVTAAFLFVSSALNGLAGSIGQQNSMSGRISSIWNALGTVPTVLGYFVGGKLSSFLEGKNVERAVHMLFLSSAGIMAFIGAFGLWKPKSVFNNIDTDFVKKTPIADLKRLLKYRPLYPALIIWLMWCFQPGTATPLQYYMQNTLHATDADWGEWNAIFAAFTAPTAIIYGFVCKKFPLGKLLLFCTIAAIPEFIPILFIHSMKAAMILAVPIGLMAGAATTSYIDLLIESSPPGLQGTTLMLSIALFHIGGRFGDVIGAVIFDKFGGFNICVLATTITYLLILPVLRLVPVKILYMRDAI